MASAGDVIAAHTETVLVRVRYEAIWSFAVRYPRSERQADVGLLDRDPVDQHASARSAVNRPRIACVGLPRVVGIDRQSTNGDVFDRAALRTSDLNAIDELIRAGAVRQLNRSPGSK